MSPPALRPLVLQRISALTAGGGLLALALVVAELHWPVWARLVAGGALALPLLMGLGQFTYKARVGIRLPWLALTWWALWQSYAWASPLVLLLRLAPERLELLAAGVLLAQWLALATALREPVRHLRTLAFPGLCAALGLASQLAVMLAAR